MRGRPPKYLSALPADDFLNRLRLDPGSRTLGELLQERDWALAEIVRLRQQVAVTSPTATHPSARLQIAEGAPANPSSASISHTFMSSKQVRDDLGISNSTLYRWAAEGSFPKPVKLGIRASRWRTEDVQEWKKRAHQMARLQERMP